MRKLIDFPQRQLSPPFSVFLFVVFVDDELKSLFVGQVLGSLDFKEAMFGLST